MTFISRDNTLRMALGHTKHKKPKLLKEL